MTPPVNSTSTPTSPEANPYTNYDVVCQIDYTEAVTCNENQYCKWDVDDNECESNDLAIEGANMEACSNLTRIECLSERSCEYEDDGIEKCKGSDSIIKSSNATDTTQTQYINYEVVCLRDYVNSADCAAIMYCKWDVDDNECEPNHDVIGDENTATCINLTATECLDNLACEYDDQKCEGSDTYIKDPNETLAR
eukprot:Awhi_evm1s6463